MSEITETIVEKLIKGQQELLGLNFVASVVVKMQNHPTELTSVHAWMLQLCLASKCLKSAEPFLIEEIDDFSVDVRTYFAFTYFINACKCMQYSNPFSNTPHLTVLDQSISIA